MKVLVFDEWFPWPLDCGKKIRTYNLLKRFSEKHDIVYVAYGDRGDDEESLSEVASWCYKVVPVRDVRVKKWTLGFYLRVLVNVFEKIPFSSVYHVTDKFEKVLYREIEHEKPDLILCEWTNLAPLLAHVRNIPTVISSHNIESDIWKRIYTNEKSILRRLVARQQATRIEMLEREWYARAKYCIAVSDLDRDVINSYGARACTVCNGVDIAYYGDDVTEATANEIVFTASFDTISNQDGAEYMIENIFPIIYAKDPSVKLTLIGKNPPKRLVGLVDRHPNVMLTGWVADVRPYLARARICTVPLRIGGGSRLKILEAWAMKRPVVSTSIGAEGIDFEHGNNILIADDPHEFARQIIWLLSDRERAKEIADAGYAQAVRKYDWSVLGLTLERELRSVVSAQGRQQNP